MSFPKLKHPLASFWTLLLIAGIATTILTHDFFFRKGYFILTWPTSDLWPAHFILIATLLIEAATYRKLRKKNAQHRLTWIHILLLAAAYLAPILKEGALEFYDNYYSGWDIRTYISTVTIIQDCFFWACTLTAHMIFLHILKLVRTKPDQQPDPTSKNLLDDLAP